MTSSPESFSTRGADGVRIMADRLGDPGAPAVVFLHGGGQTRRSWGRAAAAVASRGWQAVTVDFRGHGESDWSDAGDYRVTTFAGDVLDVLRRLPPRPVLVGASLGGLTSMLLAGELAPGTARAIVLVDIVPNMNPAGTARIHEFMNDRMTSGFDSLEEVADAIGAYNPQRPRPTDLDGLRTNLRQRDGRWYWHWDPKFIDGTSALPPIEVTDVDRLHAAVEAILRDGVPMLLVRGQVSDLVTEEQRADESCPAFPRSNSSTSAGPDTWSPATATTSSPMRSWNSSLATRFNTDRVDSDGSGPTGARRRTNQRMRFGNFMAPRHPTGQDPTLAIDRDLDLIGPPLSP